MNSIDFSTLLASRIHDIKNTLGFLINKIDKISKTTTDDESRIELEQLQLQSQHFNADLIQLLVLYRIKQSQYFPYTVETNIQAFIETSAEHYHQLFAQKQIALTVNCETDLYWYLDDELMSGALGNILYNLYQHTHSVVEITAKIDGQSLVIQIKDDGPGYPKDMLSLSTNQQKSFSFKSGSTGLGLYFVGVATALHQNHGKKGNIVITNEGVNGGGCITITLP